MKALHYSALLKNKFTRNRREDTLREAPKVVYILSFINNDGGLITKLARRYGRDFLLFYTSQMTDEAQRLKTLVNGEMRLMEYSHRELVIGSAFQLLEATRVIVADNYYPEFAALSTKVLSNDPALSTLKKGKHISDQSKETNERSIIQIWHATGAIKCFGWGDPKTMLRNASDRRRFQQVYDSFTDIVVGSEMMADIFKHSWRIPDVKFQFLGTPRTDELQPGMNNNRRYTDGRLASNNIRKQILYVPTYRDSITELEQILTEIFRVFSRLAAKQKFIVKLHPHVMDQLSSERLISFVGSENISLTDAPLIELIEKCDGLITDYSSCVFDFMLRHPDAPYLFYCPDLQQYRKTTGIQDVFFQEMTARLAQNQEELFTLLESLGRTTDSLYLNTDDVAIRRRWHQYNDGNAVPRLMNLIAARLE